MLAGDSAASAWEYFALFVESSRGPRTVVFQPLVYIRVASYSRQPIAHSFFFSVIGKKKTDLVLFEKIIKCLDGFFFLFNKPRAVRQRY